MSFYAVSLFPIGHIYDQVVADNHRQRAFVWRTRSPERR